jgi:uncharacterized protein (DUF697 family)
MANLFSQLTKLKNNIFGGPGNTGFTKPPASRVQDIGLQESPTGALFEDPLSVSTFSYPMDVQQNFQNGHYMLFYVNVQNKTKYKYKNLDGKDIGDYRSKEIVEERLVGHPAEGITKKFSKIIEMKGANAAEILYQKGRSLIKGQHVDFESISIDPGLDSQRKKTKAGVTSLFNNTTRIQDSIAMYLPPNVEDNTTAGYNDFRTGMAGFLAAGGSKALAQGGDAAAITQSVLDSAEGLIGKAGQKIVSEIAEVALGAEGANELINKAFGVADNPYMEVLFDAMALRTFTYTFNMAPRNEQEAAEIQNIIQVFRFHMTPELRGNQSRFIGLPSEFDIHYMFLSKDGVASENTFYNKIATCVLTNCAVNYTPNGVKSFEDGGPTATRMTLTFKEKEMLTKERINQGF